MEPVHAISQSKLDSVGDHSRVTGNVAAPSKLSPPTTIPPKSTRCLPSGIGSIHPALPSA